MDINIYSLDEILKMEQQINMNRLINEKKWIYIYIYIYIIYLIYTYIDILLLDR